MNKFIKELLIFIGISTVVFSLWLLLMYNNKEYVLCGALILSLSCNLELWSKAKKGTNKQLFHYNINK